MAGADAAGEARAGEAGVGELGPGGRGIRLLALAENLRSSTNVLNRDVTPPSFCLPMSILSAWRSRKVGGGGSEESTPAGAVNVVPELVRICEKRFCSLSAAPPPVDDEDELSFPPIPNEGTETPAFERLEAAPWLIYSGYGDGAAAA